MKKIIIVCEWTKPGYDAANGIILGSVLFFSWFVMEGGGEGCRAAHSEIRQNRVMENNWKRILWICFLREVLGRNAGTFSFRFGFYGIDKNVPFTTSLCCTLHYLWIREFAFHFSFGDEATRFSVFTVEHDPDCSRWRMLKCLTHNAK